MFSYFWDPRAVFIVLTLGLSGCASVSSPIQSSPETAHITPDIVRVDDGRFTGQIVRWGGVIASVANFKHGSRIELVAKPLSDSGRPKATDKTFGRVLVDIDGFVDPIIYAKGRELTVRGVIQKNHAATVGEQAYSFPVIRASNNHLWQKRRERVHHYYHYHPFYHSRFDPWYHYRFYRH